MTRSFRAGHKHALDEFARLAVLLAVGDEEILKRDGAPFRALAQGHRRTERNQRRRRVPDRRAVGDVAADRAHVAHLLAADAGDEIETAIKNEAVAKKEVETAEQKKQKAQKEAETKIIEAQGEAEANAAKSSQLTDQILKEKFIDKWNGELPKVSGQSESLFDISSILGK